MNNVELASLSKGERRRLRRTGEQSARWQKRQLKKLGKKS